MDSIARRHVTEAHTLKVLSSISGKLKSIATDLPPCRMQEGQWNSDGATRMPKRLREEEEWARRVIEKQLGADVHRNDDGSDDSMYDLRVGQAVRPAIPISGLH